MFKITEISEEALRRYFNTLKVFGYHKYSNVDKLIVLLFLEELLNDGGMNYYISENDYNEIIKALYYIINYTCLTDFPIFDTYDKLIRSDKSRNIFRMDETSILRASENENLRVLE